MRKKAVSEHLKKFVDSGTPGIKDVLEAHCKAPVLTGRHWEENQILDQEHDYIRQMEVAQRKQTILTTHNTNKPYLR
jgi:hypothetical protein